MTGTSANTGHKRIEAAATPNDASDQALFSLLKRIKTTNDPKEVRRLSDQLERVIFHKQFKNA